MKLHFQYIRILIFYLFFIDERIIILAEGMFSNKAKQVVLFQKRGFIFQ